MTEFLFLGELPRTEVCVDELWHVYAHVRNREIKEKDRCEETTVVPHREGLV